MGEIIGAITKFFMFLGITVLLMFGVGLLIGVSLNGDNPLVATYAKCDTAQLSVEQISQELPPREGNILVKAYNTYGVAFFCKEGETEVDTSSWTKDDCSEFDRAIDLADRRLADPAADTHYYKQNVADLKLIQQKLFKYSICKAN